MSRFFLTDADGVLLDWVSGFRVRAEKKLRRKIEGYPKKFNRLGEWIGETEKVAYEMIYDFNDNDPEFENIRPYKDAVDYLETIKKLGYNIIVISACGKKSETAQKRINNLKNIYGDIFTKIHCVGNSLDKEKILKKYPKSFWIEDTINPALQGFNAGHKTIMLRHLYNRIDEIHHPELTWVDDWSEIFEIITKEQI